MEKALQMKKYLCSKCKLKFEELGLAEYKYGEFLMRTKSNDIAYLIALNSQVFDEVSEMVNRCKLTSSLTDDDKANITQAIFGVACDLSQNHDQYSISQSPVCPSCFSDETKFFGPVIPVKMVNKSINEVTFHNWHKLTQSQKQNIIYQSISSYLNKK